MPITEAHHIHSTSCQRIQQIFINLDATGSLKMSSNLRILPGKRGKTTRQATCHTSRQATCHTARQERCAQFSGTPSTGGVCVTSHLLPCLMVSDSAHQIYAIDWLYGDAVIPDGIINHDSQSMLILQAPQCILMCHCAFIRHVIHKQFCGVVCIHTICICPRPLLASVRINC